MFRAVGFRGLSHGQGIPTCPAGQPRKERNGIELGRDGMSWRSTGLACKPLRMKAGCTHHGR
jgi:hypothetical protein